VFNVQLKTWQARGALAMPGLKHASELYVDVGDSKEWHSLQLEVSLAETLPLSCPWRWRECQT